MTDLNHMLGIPQDQDEPEGTPNPHAEHPDISHTGHEDQRGYVQPDPSIDFSGWEWHGPAAPEGELNQYGPVSDQTDWTTNDN